MPTGRRTFIKTLEKIMADPTSTTEQKLEACKIWASLCLNKIKQKEKQPEKPTPTPKSNLLG
jgi:hypothetical protein